MWKPMFKGHKPYWFGKFFKSSEEMKEVSQIKIVFPQSGLPKGRVLDVLNIQADGVVVGIDSHNDDNSTLYYVQKGDYEVSVNNK